MLISDAIQSMREHCALRHLSIQTEKFYTQWLARYGTLLKDPKLRDLSTEGPKRGFDLSEIEYGT
jgi:hypothetical protein